MMYGYGFPVCCSGYGNDGFGSNWIWAIIIVVFIIFFFCGSDRGRREYN